MIRIVRFEDAGPVTLCANHAALAGRRHKFWNDFERDLLFEQKVRERHPAALAG